MDPPHLCGSPLDIQYEKRTIERIRRPWDSAFRTVIRDPFKNPNNEYYAAA